MALDDNNNNYKNKFYGLHAIWFNKSYITILLYKNFGLSKTKVRKVNNINTFYKLVFFTKKIIFKQIIKSKKLSHASLIKSSNKKIFFKKLFDLLNLYLWKL